MRRDTHSNNATLVNSGIVEGAAGWWGGVSRYSFSQAGWKTGLGLIKKAAAAKWPCDTLPGGGLHRAVASSWPSSWQSSLKRARFSGSLDGCGAGMHKVGRNPVSQMEYLYGCAVTPECRTILFLLVYPLTLPASSHGRNSPLKLTSWLSFAF